MIFSHAFIIFLLFHLVACTTHTEKNMTHKGMSVEIQSKNPEPIIEINEAQGSLGPAPIENFKTDAPEVKKVPIVGILFADDPESIARDLNIMRELRKRRIVPRIYGGFGSGAVLATAFAFNMTPDEIEWQLFSLERKGFHSKSDRLIEFAKTFEQKSMTQSFHVLQLPNERGLWVSRGQVFDVLSLHLMAGQKWPYRRPNDLLGADQLIEIKNLKIENLDEALKFIDGAE